MAQATTKIALALSAMPDTPPQTIVDLSKSVFGGLDHPLGVRGFGDVAFECQCGTTRLMQQVKRFVEPVLAASGDGYLGAFAGKGQSDGLTDAGSPTRNHRTFSGQACHVLSPPYV